MGHSYLTTVLSTIEKQFGIKSQEAAWIFSGNEVSQICFILVIPFLSKIKKRPLWTSVALLFSSLGSFLCALPYLVKDKQQYEGGWYTNTQQTGDIICSDTANTTDTLNIMDEEYERDWLGIVFIFFGFFLSGIGSSFFVSFGIPFIDDNMPRNNSPFALSMVMASKTLGPAFGSVLGGAVLKTYVVPGQGEQLEEGDPGWLGAWWIGFVVVSVLIASFAPFLSLFPEQLPTNDAIETDAQKMEKRKDTDVGSLKSYITSTVACFERLLKNKVYLFNWLSSLCMLFGFQGFVTFGPKYFEYHFRQNASKSGSLNGISRSIGAASGILLSGFLIGKYKFRARTIAGWNLLVAGFLSAGFFVAYNLSCPKLEIYGGVGSLSPCQAACGCVDSSFQPTCSLDGHTLFISPCHAGCKSHTREEYEKDGKTKAISIYSECSCVEEASTALNSTPAQPWWREDDLQNPLSRLSGPDPISGAVAGYCPVDEDCTNKFYFLIGLFMVTGLLVASSKLGTQLLTFRAVAPEDKSASMILTISSMSLFVLLPSPVIVGSLLDNHCTVWGVQGGKTTNCLLYNTDLMRTTLFTFTGICIILSTLMDVGVWYYCKDINIFKESDDKEDKKVVTIE